MDVSWKWFDGNDWTGKPGKNYQRSQSASTSEQLFGQEHDGVDESDKTGSSRKTKLLGVLLEEHEQNKVVTESEKDKRSEKESTGEVWWNTVEKLYAIPCGREVDTMVEINLIDF